MIIRRYIISEITKPAANILLLMVAIFASYTAIVYLTDAVGGLMTPAQVGILIGLRVGMALEILLPVTLYLSVMIALGRLYKDSEMTALAACGLGTGGVVLPVLMLSLPVALIAGGASLYIRSAAYTQIYKLRAQARADFSIGQLESQRFLEIADGRYTFFSEKIDQDRKVAYKVFLREKKDDAWAVIQAQEMTDGGRNNLGYPVLTLRNGHLVEFPSSGKGTSIIRFEKAHYPIQSDAGKSGRYRRKAATTAHLLQSDSLEDVAELQWRLSTPLSTLLLALLGVPLSRTNPRRGKYAKLGTALIIFAVYYQLFTIAKTNVENGNVDPLIGIWWVPALLLALTLAMLRKTGSLRP
ncbi:MAG: LPS export ABC transporter permease LptF [Desulfobacterales bacterium]|nr:LPS export ABC transporter permease LptF [Desulfobacterales bacterium]